MGKSELTAVLALILVVSSVRVWPQQCAQLQSTSSEGLVRYLNGAVSDPNSAACVAFAIIQLGRQRYEPAVPVLTKLLDFRWPVGAHQKQRLYVLEHDGASIYPAATALQQIGGSALPAVESAIKSGQLSRESMEVAVSVWMLTYKDHAPVGVALLLQEADKSAKPIERQRMGWAAYLAALHWCSPSDRSQCKAAARVQ